MQNITVVLVGRGGELDRKEITVRDIFTFADLVAACGDWVLGDGDVIKIVEGDTP